MTKRFAAIDVGTNSVLLLVAERSEGGRWAALLERCEITRLGRGVDATRRLGDQAIEDTVRVLETFAREARQLGAADIVVSTTSAARDASNGGEFLGVVRRRTDLSVEVLSGDEEARLSFASAFADFGGARPLVMVDIGGGSTELVFGDAAGAITYRRSFDVGSVRMTERFVHADPPSETELQAVAACVRDALSVAPRAPAGFELVGIAGTVTTLCALARHVEPYDPLQVHGAELTLTDLTETLTRLARLPLELRRTLPGLQPKRADVIVAGAIILVETMRHTGAPLVRVSDRGLRWGLLADRFRA